MYCNYFNVHLLHCTSKELCSFSFLPMCGEIFQLNLIRYFCICDAIYHSLCYRALVDLVEPLNECNGTTLV